MKEGEISKKMKEFLAAHKVVTASVEMSNVIKVQHRSSEQCDVLEDFVFCQKIIKDGLKIIIKS